MTTNPPQQTPPESRSDAGCRPGKASWRDWCSLVRLPNVFTVLADTSAAYLLVAHRIEPLASYLSVIAAIVCIYWAGMILNDVYDLEIDRQHRPDRPLPSGRIDAALAHRAAMGLLTAGVVLSLVSGLWAARYAAESIVPGLLGMALVGAVVLYDGLLKKSVFAPGMMGTCRGLSFLLGASAATSDYARTHFFDGHVVAIALGMGLYITGVTIMARRESVGSQRGLLVGGLAVWVLGLTVVAAAPLFAPPNSQFFLMPPWKYSLLIGLLAATVARRSWQAIQHPEPREIQHAIKVALLTLIPLSAAIAMLGAGPGAGIAVLALLLPAMYLGRFLQMT